MGVAHRRPRRLSVACERSEGSVIYCIHFRKDWSWEDWSIVNGASVGRGRRQRNGDLGGGGGGEGGGGGGGGGGAGGGRFIVKVLGPTIPKSKGGLEVGIEIE